jgi:hypothetical protein
MNLKNIYRVLIQMHCVFVTERILFIRIYVNELRFLEAHKKYLHSPLGGCSSYPGKRCFKLSMAVILYNLCSSEYVVMRRNKLMKGNVNLSLCLTN